MELPNGTVTFLFTDIEGSTRLWEEQPEAMQIALARHDEILPGGEPGRPPAGSGSRPTDLIIPGHGQPTEPGSTGRIPVPPLQASVDEAMVEVGSQLVAETFAEAWDMGQKMSLEVVGWWQQI